MDAPISVYAKYVPLRVSTTYIDEKGVSQNIDADVVTDATDAPVTWGTASETSWYVVTGKDVKLSQGSICAGHVNLILADGAKLTATGADDKPGIEVSGEGNSLTIYGYTNQSGQLIAIGGANAAGIGGGNAAAGSNITIYGGVITANGGENASAIGSGNGGDAASNIFVATSFVVKADGNNPPTTVIAATRTATTDIAADLAGQRYATIEKGTNAQEPKVDETGITVNGRKYGFPVRLVKEVK
mgnify:CR=1 FL=1